MFSKSYISSEELRVYDNAKMMQWMDCWGVVAFTVIIDAKRLSNWEINYITQYSALETQTSDLPSNYLFTSNFKIYSMALANVDKKQCSDKIKGSANEKQ